MLREFLKKFTIKRNNKIVAYLYFKTIVDSLNPLCKKQSFSLFLNEYKNTFIYMANGYLNHGGVIDRTKGILTTYYLSKENNFDFKIYYVSPMLYFNVWDSPKINVEKLKLNPFKFRIIYISTLSELERLRKENFYPTKGAFLIYCSENIIAHIYPNGKWEKKTRDLYNEMVLLGENKIKLKANKEIEIEDKNNLTVVHYRCLNYFNDFEDSNLKPLENKIIDDVVKKIIEDALKKYDTNENYIFISDSRYLLRRLQEKGFNILSLNPTKHIDNKGHNNEEYLNAYLENYYITKAKFVFDYTLYHKSKPFNSHFAYYPSIFGESEFSNYTLNTSNLEINKGLVTK